MPASKKFQNELSIFQKLGNAFASAISTPTESKDVIALREQLEKQTRHLQKSMMEDGSFAGPNWLGNVVDPWEPLFDDPNFYAPLFGVEKLPPTLNKTLRGELLPIYITWYGLKVIRDFSRQLCTLNEFAIGAIENRCNYICGKGFQHKLMPKNGYESAETMYYADIGQKWIDEFSQSQNWNECEQEAVMRCDRDGETFMRFFHVGQGKTEFRFIEPEWVQGPDDSDVSTYGIVNSPGDVVNVLGYWVTENPPMSRATYVAAEEILHIKCNSDSTSKRGLPTFYPIRKNLQRAEKLLRNMSVLAQIQATFAIIRQHKNYSVAAVNRFRQEQSDVQWANPFNGQQQYGKNYAPGTILDIPESTSYEFPSIGVNASNLVAILQAELQAAGQRVNMPAYMFSGDTGNVNLATAFIAESPFVKGMEKKQAFFARRFGDGSMVKVKNSGAMWRVLANAVDSGGAPKEILTHCELIVEGPTLIVRDKTQETQRNAMLNQAKLLSRSTWSKWEGLDKAQENKQIEGEDQEDIKRQDQQGLAQAKLQVEQQLLQQQESQQQAQQQQMMQQMQQMGLDPNNPQDQAKFQQMQAQQQAQQQGQQGAQGQGGQEQQQQAQQGAQQPQSALPFMQQGQQGGQDLQQRDVGLPGSDSGYTQAQMGGNLRDLAGLRQESVEMKDPRVAGLSTLIDEVREGK